MVMGFDIAWFEWKVPTDGYHWIDQQQPEGDGWPAAFHRWVLTDRIEVRTPAEYVRYNPLRSERTLYRLFADLTFDDREAIREFANKYGRLGVGNRGVQLSDPREDGYVPAARAESHFDWATGIVEMRRAVELWAAIKDRNETGLKRYLRWDAGRVTGRSSRGGWSYYNREAPFPTFIPVPTGDEPEDRSDVRSAGWRAIQAMINHHLRDGTIPQLVFDPRSERLIPQFVPSNLYAALWTQFASAVAADKGLGVCKQCAKMFEVSADARTARREFCSVRCKTRDHRRRKARARELQAEGKTLGEIVRRLVKEGWETEAATVRGWVSKKGRR
jgi:hypothetical protein